MNMNPLSRRSFLKTGAAAAGALGAGRLFRAAWPESARAAATGYFESEFGITDALCGRILGRALSKGGDFADLFFEHSIMNNVVLEDGQVNRAYCDVTLGVGIRTVKGDQVGYGFTQDLTEKSMAAAADTAATIADAGKKKAASRFTRVKTANYYPMQQLLSEVPLSAKLPIVQSVNDKCFARSNLIVKVNCGFSDTQRRILVVTSDGQKSEDLQPKSYLSANVVAEKNGKKERTGWNLGGKREFSYYTPALADKLAGQVVDRVLVLFEAVQPPAGEMPVVLGPGVTGILLHEAIGHGMEADFNRKKISTYSAMIGKKVAESSVTIVDDGTNPFQNGSLNVDDEGVPGQKTVLVENGILVGYLHDRISARHYGVDPTGNGRRQSYEHYPIPRMRNTYMAAGGADPEEIIRGAQNGIYVQDVSNGQVKIGEGDFAFYVSQGRMIENGRLTTPIKDVNIMGNGPKMLANVAMVGHNLEMSEGGAGYCGKDGQAVPVSFGLPTLLVKSMTVGGTAQKGA
jgi:TldD protein